MRELGLREAKHAAAHDKYEGLMQIVRLVSMDCPVFSPALFKQALRFVYSRHPALGARLIKSNDTWQIEYDVSFDDIPHRFEKLDNIDQTEYLEKEISDALPADCYLWRTHLIQINNSHDVYVLITSHHAATDGISAVSIINDLIDCYNRLDKKEDVVVQSLKRRPPMEETLVPCSRMRDMSDMANIGNHSTWPVESTATKEIRAPLLLKKQFPPLVVQQLLDSCRDANTTLNALLSAVAFRSAFVMPDAPEFIKMLVVKSARSRMQPPLTNNEVGVYIDSGLAVAHRNEIDDIYTLAVASDRQYQMSLPVNKSYTPVDLDDYLTQFVDSDSGVFKQHIVLSNIGRLKPTYTTGALSLLDFRNSISIHSSNMFLFLSAITCNDKLTCNFNFTYPLVSRMAAENFAEHFASDLYQLAKIKADHSVK
jgi:hypothetical protein